MPAVTLADAMTFLASRQRQILCLLWREGRLSRWELHERMGVNPNAIGADVGELLDRGLVRECPPEPAGPGRPRVPVDIDTSSRNVAGLAIGPGLVEAGQLNLRGEPAGEVRSREVGSPEQMVSAARDVLGQVLDERTLAVGLSSPGFIDPETPAILSSSALRGKGSASLAPLFEIAGERPLLIENDMHALAARWLLSQKSAGDEDVLLVSIGDGQLGAALLVDGRPNRGCAIGGNELGHTRYFVETEPCYCGHSGCLERIASTAFLLRQGDARGSLASRAAEFDGSDAGMDRVLDCLATGLSNAVNFIRPNRMVISGLLAPHARFIEALVCQVRSRVFVELAQRVRIEVWNPPAAQSAQTAGWLALASLYRENWNRAG
jgi:predicted NBD/HSP70 family sugar kinase